MSRFIIALIISSIFSTCYAKTLSYEVEQISSKQQLQELPLKVSVLPDEAVLSWSKKYILEVYTFYFEDIDKWRVKIKPYFSTHGYNEFIDSMTKSNTLDTVKQKKLIVQVKVEGEPRVVIKGINNSLYNKIYTWYVVIPIKVTYLGPNNKKSHDMLVVLEIVRKNQSESTDNIVIDSLNVYPNDKTEKSMQYVIKKVNEKATIQKSD